MPQRQPITPQRQHIANPSDVPIYAAAAAVEASVQTNASDLRYVLYRNMHSFC